MKLSTKIGGKWTFSVTWVKDKSRKRKPLYMRITYQRTNTKTCTNSNMIGDVTDEFILLEQLANIGFELGYEGKELIRFVVEYKDKLSTAIAPHTAIVFLDQEIKNLEFAKRKFKKAVQQYSINKNK